jgi:rfaE bifunctional protein kinase chain/domain
MITISEDRKREIFANFSGRKIMVVGDLMLDRYLWGRVARISPEAPVPVVEIESEATRLGGAANVSHNLAALKSTAIPVGVVGDDDNAEVLIDLFWKMNFITDGIIKDKSRITSVKTRIIAHNQHVVRADKETKEPIHDKLVQKLMNKVNKLINDCDAIIFQDYNKGLLTPELIKSIVMIANSKKKTITVDPKFDNFFCYRDVTLFKPNKKETEGALGIRITNEADLFKAIKHLKQKLSCKNVLITLGEKGMCLLEQDDELSLIPTKAQQVHDVSGAGDTVISTLTLALTAGASMKEATSFANFAAGIVCSEVGVVPVYFEQLIEAIK